MRTLLIGEVRSAEHALAGMLEAGLPPAAIVTTPRARIIAESAMDPEYMADLEARGAAAGIPVEVVADVREVADVARALAPDHLFFIGWPYLVREPVLSIGTCIGLHPSRLPVRRGGAPLNWAILDGEREAAVSLLRLREGVDSGEILAQRAFDIAPDDYVGDVLSRVYRITEDLVATSMRALAAGTAQWIPQDDAQATYTRRRTPDDGRIGWRDSALRIRNLVRAVSKPFPGAFSYLEDCRWTIWRAELPIGYRAPVKAAPGTLLQARADGVLVATRDNALLITAASLDEGGVRHGAELARAAERHLGHVFT